MASKLSKEVAQVKKAIRMLQDAQLELDEVRSNLHAMGYTESGKAAFDACKEVAQVKKAIRMLQDAQLDLWRKLI